MRIVCQSVPSFIENLKLGKVVEGVVWIDQTKREVKPCIMIVNLQASAILEVETGQILVQYGEDCGQDFLDGETELKGSEGAKARRDRLIEWCEEHQLRVKPGLVDM